MTQQPAPTLPAAEPRPDTTDRPPDPRHGHQPTRRRGVLAITAGTALAAIAATIGIAWAGGDGSPDRIVGRSEAEVRAITEDLVARGVIPPQSLIPLDRRAEG